VGFLLTGVLCGPSLLGVVRDRQAIDHVAEIGVALLLFTSAWSFGRRPEPPQAPVLSGGSPADRPYGAGRHGPRPDPGPALPAGRSLGLPGALSSSAIVLRIMQEKGSTNTPTGRLSRPSWSFRTLWWPPCCSACPCSPARWTFP
jgi:CPA2 family monovalent cation:H+ antiporter-2